MLSFSIFFLKDTTVKKLPLFLTIHFILKPSLLKNTRRESIDSADYHSKFHFKRNISLQTFLKNHNNIIKIIVINHNFKTDPDVYGY